MSRIKSKKELLEDERRAAERAWKQEHNFREIEKCCYLCSYHSFSKTSPPFGACQLSAKELKKQILIIDNNFVCDGWELADFSAEVKAEKQRIFTGKPITEKKPELKS
jgi:hypothetical protein